MEFKMRIEDIPGETHVQELMEKMESKLQRLIFGKKSRVKLVKVKRDQEPVKNFKIIMMDTDALDMDKKDVEQRRLQMEIELNLMLFGNPSLKRVFIESPEKVSFVKKVESQETEEKTMYGLLESVIGELSGTVIEIEVIKQDEMYVFNYNGKVNRGIGRGGYISGSLPCNSIEQVQERLRDLIKKQKKKEKASLPLLVTVKQ